MPECSTPLFRLLVIIPGLGRASMQYTSEKRAAAAAAIAAPTTPAPTITTVRESILTMVTGTGQSRLPPNRHNRRHNPGVNSAYPRLPPPVRYHENISEFRRFTWDLP